MEVFVARQPIFNDKEEVIAYELLYRSSRENSFSFSDGDKATSDVIINSFLNIGIRELTNGKPSFINFTNKLLTLKVPTYFNPMAIIIEILETVKPTREIIDICIELKSLGYTIALDDFFLMHGDEETLSLLNYVDIVKIDFRSTSRIARNEMMNYLKPYNLKFLAEKVETREEYEEARRDGYSYFQGYFFSKPVILNSHDIPAYFQNYLLILEKLDIPEPDIHQIAEVIEHDLSLSYKLLKFINSPVFRPKNEITSIKQAIIYLGLNELKKWIYVLAVRGAQESPDSGNSRELIHLSLTRAKLCESIGRREFGDIASSTYFLLGMFSLIDSILNLSIERILDELPLHTEIKDALLGKENEMKEFLDFIKAAERMELNSKNLVKYPYSVDETELFDLYSQANHWASEILNTEVASYL